jgi:hypothetical protein
MADQAQIQSLYSLLLLNVLSLSLLQTISSAASWPGDRTWLLLLLLLCLSSRTLRDEHFDFGRDRDRMDLKTLVSGRDRSGWDFLGIVSGLFGIFWDYKILFNYAAFVHCESEHLWSLILLLTDKQNCTLSTCGLYSCC